MYKMSSTVSEVFTMSNFNSAPKSSAICYQLFTSGDSFNNYICLTCCELKESAKSIFYCKYCVTHCLHADLKDHYFIKVTESTRCVCAYSGCCKSEGKVVICADKLGAVLKKEWQCWKCQLSYCMVCV